MLCCAWPIPSHGAGGWYLVSPPGTFDDSDPANPVFRIDSRVPMSRWHHVAAYDSAKECEKEKIEQKRLIVVTGEGLPKGDRMQRELSMTISELRCIATDDPRLAPRPVETPKGK
jgi:hypothetical protein